MSIRRTATAPVPLSVHTTTQDAWTRLLQHPASAPLTHVLRRQVGAPMQPGTAPDGALSNTDNLRMLIPFILIAFRESASSENRFMNLCSKVTKLLATNKQLNNPEAWLLVLKELRMPLTVERNSVYWSWPYVTPTDPEYPKMLFRFYCERINTRQWNMDTYPASGILGEWQHIIAASSSRGSNPSFEEFKESVLAWTWVINNYQPFNPYSILFAEFLTKLIKNSSDQEWEFFIDKLSQDVDSKLDMSSFYTELSEALLQERDGQLERRRTMQQPSNKTFEFVMTRMPTSKLASFLVTLVTLMVRKHVEQFRTNKQEFEKDDIPYFYKTLILPIITKIATFQLRDRYQQFLAEVANQVVKSVEEAQKSELANIDVKIWMEIYVSTVYETRVFLTNAFPPDNNFVDNFETVVTDEDIKKTIRMLLSSNMNVWDI